MLEHLFGHCPSLGGSHGRGLNRIVRRRNFSPNFSIFINPSQSSSSVSVIFINPNPSSSSVSVIYQSLLDTKLLTEYQTIIKLNTLDLITASYVIICYYILQ